MNYLWSPWRMDYLKSLNTEEGCVFCNEAARPEGPENLVVYHGQRVFVILNRYPYTSGHLMAVPYDHQPSLELLEAETRAEMMELASRSICILREVYHPQGFNVGVNIGDSAGAGIAEHVHLHVVPRWIGDTSFMSSLGQTRVLPELLEETCRRVREAWHDS